jgi:hypothetical protein
LFLTYFPSTASVSGRFPRELAKKPLEAVLKAGLEQYPAHREERLTEVPVIFRAINKR